MKVPMESMEDFTFPTTVKQIGSIGKGLKIYIEDYAMTYLNQYAATGGKAERIAVLIGKPLTTDGENILLIVGAICGKHSRLKNGSLSFTEEDWEYIEEERAKYFNEYEVVGWMHSQPGYGVFLNTNDAVIHSELFEESYKVLFLVDSSEKIDTFFAWDEHCEQLMETSGYFIYYEKNKNMHEYMLENKVVSVKSEMEEEFSADARLREPIVKKQERVRKEFTQRKVINMLGSLCAILFCVSIIMLASLIQNGSRISKLEENIESVNKLYSAMVAQLTNQNTASVFADDLKNADSAESNPQEQTDQPSPETTTVSPMYDITTEADVQPIETKVSQVPDYYVVQSGDTLSYISMRFYGTKSMQQKIMELNDITDPDNIFYGKKLKLPQP